MGVGIFEPRIRNVLRAGPLRRVREGLGGSHTVVTYPPLDALRAATHLPAEIVPIPEPLNLYFHVAFCEHICPFCHYAKTLAYVDEDSDQVVTYMEALQKEIALRKSELGSPEIESIYVGGGTPTSLSMRLLEQLLRGISDFGSSRVKQFCVETSPITAASSKGREKLQMLREGGVNRFSIGIQTFDDAILRATRGHDQLTAVRAVEHLLKTGAEVNIDLIQDLPHQTWDSIEQDLAKVATFRPQQITWYLLRFHDEASWHKAFRNQRLDGLPDDTESALRRIRIVQRMQDLGYERRPGGRFLLSTETRDHYKEVRGGTEKPLLGFGVSAYSHGWGWFFRNLTAKSTKAAVANYVERMRKGASPVAYAFELTDAERAAGRLVSSVRGEIDLNWLDAESPDAGRYLETIDHLLDQEILVRSSDGAITLSEIGLAFEEEVASLFYSSEVIDRLAERGAYWLRAKPVNPDSSSIAHHSTR